MKHIVVHFRNTSLIWRAPCLFLRESSLSVTLLVSRICRFVVNRSLLDAMIRCSVSTTVRRSSACLATHGHVFHILLRIFHRVLFSYPYLFQRRTFVSRLSSNPFSFEMHAELGPNQLIHKSIACAAYRTPPLQSLSSSISRLRLQLPFSPFFPKSTAIFFSAAFSSSSLSRLSRTLGFLHVEKIAKFDEN